MNVVISNSAVSIVNRQFGIKKLLRNTAHAL